MSMHKPLSILLTGMALLTGNAFAADEGHGRGATPAIPATPAMPAEVDRGGGPEAPPATPAIPATRAIPAEPSQEDNGARPDKHKREHYDKRERRE